MPAGVNAGNQLSHPGGAGAILVLYFTSQRCKYLIQGFASRYNHAAGNHATLVERAERIQIAVKGLILAVPLQINRYIAFYIINFMTTDKLF